MKKSKKNKFVKQEVGGSNNKEDAQVQADHYSESTENNVVSEPNNEVSTPNNAVPAPNNGVFEPNNGGSEPNKCFLNGEPFEKKSINIFPPSVREKIESDFFGEKNIDQNLCDHWNKKLNSFAIFKFSMG